MGIAANYTMHAYCDGNHPPHELTYDHNEEFIGESWADVCRQARKAGWAISKDRQRAYCPDCNKWKNRNKK